MRMIRCKHESMCPSMRKLMWLSRCEHQSTRPCVQQPFWPTFIISCQAPCL